LPSPTTQNSQPTTPPGQTNPQPTTIATNPTDNPQPTTQNTQPDPGSSIPDPTSTPWPTIDIKTPKEIAREVVTFERVEKLNAATEQPLGVVKTGAMKVKEADRALEMYVQSYLDEWIFRAKIFWFKLTQ